MFLDKNMVYFNECSMHSWKECVFCCWVKFYIYPLDHIGWWCCSSLLLFTDFLFICLINYRERSIEVSKYNFEFVYFFTFSSINLCFMFLKTLLLGAYTSRIVYLPDELYIFLMYYFLLGLLYFTNWSLWISSGLIYFHTTRG